MRILGKDLRDQTYIALETRKVNVGHSSPKDEPNYIINVFVNHSIYKIKRNDGTCLTKEAANQLVKQIAIADDLIDLDMFQMAIYDSKEAGIPVTNVFDEYDGEVIPLIVTKEDEE